MSNETQRLDTVHSDGSDEVTQTEETDDERKARMKLTRYYREFGLAGYTNGEKFEDNEKGAK